MGKPERAGVPTQKTEAVQELGIRGARQQRGKQRIFLRAGSIDVVEFFYWCVRLRTRPQPCAANNGG
jgi:hypothetical protein